MADNIQHGIDDNPNNDAEKGAALGGLGGAAVGAAAGSLAGPLGTVVGAVAGGLIGAGASGAAVAAVDQIDNDNTVSGLGDGATVASDTTLDSNDARLRGTGATTDAGYQGTGYGTAYDPTTGTNTVPAVPAAGTVDADLATTTPGGHNVVTGGPATTDAGNTGLAAGAVAGGLIGTAVGGPVGAVVGGTLGSLAGGVAGDAAEASDDAAIAPDTTGYTTDNRTVASSDDIAAANNYSGSAFQAEGALNPAISPIDTSATRANDDVLRPSEQTDYRSVDNGLTSIGSTDQNADMSTVGGLSTPGVRIGDDVPGIQTGGTTTQGPDTRGIIEKTADAMTGDNVDDKTGGRVLNDRAHGNQ